VSDQSFFSAAEVAAVATRGAIARLLRGTTWHAVTREIAWRAIREAEADGGRELIGKVGSVVDEVLSERIDGIECRVDAAAVGAWHDHLRWRAHDLAGAELVATIAASEEAERLVVAAYDEALRCAEEAASAARQAAGAQKPRRRLFLRRARRGQSTPQPSVDLGDLGRPRERYGWPRRDAA
jgi:hypothetical protein